MSQYILRRLLLMVPTFLGMTLVLFVITRIVPGGPLEMAIMELQNGGGGMSDSGMSSGGSGAGTGSVAPGSSPLSPEQMDQLKAHFGFDKPWMVAYVDWLWKFVRLDFGYSFTYYIPVIDLIVDRLPVSAYYGILTFIIMYLVCIPLGIAKALTHKTKFDMLTSVLMFIGFAVPAFVVGVVLLVFLGGYLQWFPLGGFVSDDLFFGDPSWLEIALDVMYHSILPLICYLMGSFAGLTYGMKSFLLEEISQDYVRTAVSKGVPYNQAVVKHAIRNSIIPIASGFGDILLIFLGGSMLIEMIFNIDGLALLNYNSIVGRDYPVVIASTAMVTIIALVGRLLGDIIVAVVDPRVKYT